MIYVYISKNQIKKKQLKKTMIAKRTIKVKFCCWVKAMNLCKTNKKQDFTQQQSVWAKAR